MVNDIDSYFLSNLDVLRAAETFHVWMIEFVGFRDIWSHNGYIFVHFLTFFDLFVIHFSLSEQVLGNV